jgi:C4-type Zn-finger protein
MKEYKIGDKNHTDIIKCPNCGEIQLAIVEHTIPFYSYIHKCTKCRYIIMESEWEIVKK